MSRIGFARRWAADEGRDVSFAVGDAESLPFRAGFTAILILGGSFAHSVDWERNAALLRRLRAAILPGGILLIDNPNPLRFWQVHHSTQSFPPEGDLPFFDLPLGRPQSAGVVRYYGAAAMERLLQEAGFRVESILGDREGARYVPGSSRLIAIGAAPPPVPDGTQR
jgi:SAM-dependent methyltransferase